MLRKLGVVVQQCQKQPKGFLTHLAPREHRTMNVSERSGSEKGSGACFLEVANTSVHFLLPGNLPSKTGWRLVSSGGDVALADYQGQLLTNEPRGMMNQTHTYSTSEKHVVGGTRPPPNQGSCLTYPPTLCGVLNAVIPARGHQVGGGSFKTLAWKEFKVD